MHGLLLVGAYHSHSMAVYIEGKIQLAKPLYSTFLIRGKTDDADVHKLRQGIDYD